MIETAAKAIIAFLGLFLCISENKIKNKKEFYVIVLLITISEIYLICGENITSKRYQSIFLYPLILFAAYALYKLLIANNKLTEWSIRNIIGASIFILLITLDSYKIAKPREYKSYINNLIENLEIMMGNDEGYNYLINTPEKYRIEHYNSKIDIEESIETENIKEILETNNQLYDNYEGMINYTITTKDSLKELFEGNDYRQVFHHYTSNKKNKAIISFLKQAGPLNPIREVEGPNIVQNPGFEEVDTKSKFNSYYKESSRFSFSDHANDLKFPSKWILYLRNKVDSVPREIYLSKSNRISGEYSLYLNSNDNKFSAMISTGKIKKGKYYFSLRAKGLLNKKSVLTVFTNTNPIVDMEEATCFIIDHPGIKTFSFVFDNSNKENDFNLIISVNGAVIIDDVCLIKMDD